MKNVNGESNINFHNNLTTEKIFVVFAKMEYIGVNI
jgi:hypothetical protein